MDEFNELSELELVELIDKKNELLNELEAFDDGSLYIDDIREIEIYDELDQIYEQIDLLEGME